MSLSEKAKLVPSKFHGKPVKIKLLIHSNSVHAAENDKTFPCGLLYKQVNVAAIAVNKPKNAPPAINAGKMSQPSLSASIKSALHIQLKLAP